MLSFLFLFSCILFVLFVCVKSSCKKKIMRFKIALIASFTLLLAQLHFQTENMIKAALKLEASVTNTATYYFSCNA